MIDMNQQNTKFRYEPKETDIKVVEDIVRSSGFFRDDEIAIAVELVQERLIKGKVSGYEFVFLEFEDKTVAYACFGAIPCSLVSYDLYWIATHNTFRGHGFGSMVICEVERIVKEQKGLYLYIETSLKELYTATQKFYKKHQYEQKAVFDDFYDIGDSKIVYAKKLN
jgi:ribosomal protein S18 acetylase RimI-like enzyme